MLILSELNLGHPDSNNNYNLLTTKTRKSCSGFGDLEGLGVKGRGGEGVKPRMTYVVSSTLQRSIGSMDPDEGLVSILVSQIFHPVKLMQEQIQHGNLWCNQYCKNNTHRFFSSTVCLL